MKCGMKVPDVATFCPRCGESLKEISASIIQQNQKENNELDRKALQIYLGDVLALECIVSRLQMRIRSTNNEISQINNNNYYRKYSWDGGYHHLHFYYDGKSIYIAYVDNKAAGVYTNNYLNTDSDYMTYYWLGVDANYRQLRSGAEYIHVTSGLYGFFENMNRKQAARDAFELYYQEFKKEAPNAYIANINRIKRLIQDREGETAELAEANNLLEKAYSVNIIPDSFRHNLYAIYYLHNFIKTSQESFTTALLHCDLDEIKKKLDKIIEQQRDIIIQQAAIAAQNQTFIRQNQAQLDNLSRIESNTALAAQYSAIAANNAEACAWIGLANYISINNK